MRSITVNLYQYDELSDKAKEKARNWYRSCDNGEFAEDVIYDAKEISKLFGLQIDKVYYSGFWSQGDGASFTGYYSYQKGALKAVKSYAGRDTELHQIVEQLQEIQRKSFYGVSCKIRQHGNYVHEMTMQFDIDISRQSYDDMEDELAEVLRDYARWIYKRLEAEYDYQNSDEAVEESIISVGYEFLESGDIA
jgi:hypothetical protein